MATYTICLQRPCFDYARTEVEAEDWIEAHRKATEMLSKDNLRATLKTLCWEQGDPANDEITISEVYSDITNDGIF
jgi:hypothetical protein